MNSNILVSSFNANDLNLLSPSLVRKYHISNIGHNLYSWPSWMNLLEQNVNEEINNFKNVNYIFYPLSVIKRTQYTKDGIINLDATDAILFILNSIHNLDKNILVILRPHPTTKLDELKNILKRSKHKNVKISQINSLFLIKYSKFIVHHGVSMMDPKTIIFNKICLRFHNSALIKALGPELRLSKDKAIENIIDITDKVEFKRILQKVFNNEINILENNISIPNEEKLISNFINISKIK